MWSLVRPKGAPMTTPRDDRCTLEDVAARTGVSRATVSRVVNGSPQVSDGVRRAVEAAIDEMGYAPNRAARSLAGSRSETIALVVSEPSVRLFADPFFAGTTLGVTGVLAGTRYQLVLLMVGGDDDRARVERHLLRGAADGALVLSARADDPLPGRLAAAGIPCVTAGRPSAARAEDGGQIVFVDADNVGGAEAAVSHLVAGGRRTIGTIAGPADMAPGADRRTGWEKALGEAGRAADDGLVAEADFTRAGGRAATEELLARRGDLDGLFAASDLMALGALDALRAAGRRVPDDVAVVGFDDTELARTADPPLTTVRQPIEQLGAEMARLLVARLDGDVAGASPESIVLRTELVIRASG
jgi:DNA-binding LacI/PurR family transcriptional regulator